MTMPTGTARRAGSVRLAALLVAPVSACRPLAARKPR